MNPGDVILVNLPDASGPGVKLRPALFLAHLPGPYQDVLTCGISTKLHLIRANWDEVIQPGDPDFAASSLHQSSVVRLSYLSAIRHGQIVKRIGRVDPARLLRLLTRLADHLHP